MPRNFWGWQWFYFASSYLYFVVQCGHGLGFHLCSNVSPFLILAPSLESEVRRFFELLLKPDCQNMRKIAYRHSASALSGPLIFMTPYSTAYFLKSLSIATIVRRSLFAKAATCGSFAPCPIMCFDNFVDGTSATM